MLIHMSFEGFVGCQTRNVHKVAVKLRIYEYIIYIEV